METGQEELLQQAAWQALQRQIMQVVNNSITVKIEIKGSKAFMNLEPENDFGCALILSLQELKELKEQIEETKQ